MTATKIAKVITDAKRVVVKIGSALLVDDDHGTVHRAWLDALAQDLAALRAAGKDVMIVSSGAIAVGRRYLGLPPGQLRLEDKQAAAAVGMVRLAHAYQDVLGHHGLTVAQVLLTLDDTESRRRYLNARNTIEAILRLGGVPLINENDTVATDEIRVGDNDRLGARVAAMAGADLLVLLSDIDGLYSADPTRNADATPIDEVDAITPEIEAMAGMSSSTVGSGGMVTKLAAAKIAMGAGTAMVITDGRVVHPIAALQDGARATLFRAHGNPRQARKQWIAGSLKPVGALIVDDGALGALKSGKSLLPAGIADVDGRFDRGDAVAVRDGAGREVARGLVMYSSDEARLIAGCKSAEIEARLGYRRRDEIIHRDDLVVL